MAISTRDKILDFVHRNNGVRLCDICLNLHLKSHQANNHLNYLREKEYVYSVQYSEKNVFKWYSLLVRNADALWVIPSTSNENARYY